MAQPASAHSGTTDPFGGGSLFTDIKAGSTGIDIGDAWFNRSDDGDGTETLRVHFHVPGGVSEWHLCYGGAAYTEKMSPGHCELQSGSLNPNPTTGDITVDLGSAFVGKTLYAQFHLVTQGETTYAGWQPGQPFYGNIGIEDTNPANPSASIAAADCVNDGAVVSLSNSGGESVTFTIAKNGSTVTTVAVAGGGTGSYTVALAEDETAAISVSAPGMTTVSRSVTLDCEQDTDPANPGASIAAADCVNDGAVVSLSNSGGESVTFTIAKNGSTVTTVAVAGGGTGSYTVALAEDETAAISVSAPGMTTVSRSVTLDCEQDTDPANPGASIADASCTANGAIVSLANTGGESVTFTISKAGSTLTTIAVAAGGTASYTVPLAEDETATVAVSAPGMTTVSKSVTKNCVLNEVIVRTDTTTNPSTNPSTNLAITSTPRVAGVQAARGAALAATGMPASTLRLTELALGLLLIGSVLVRRGRRQHR